LPTAGRQLRLAAYRAIRSAAPTHPPGGRLPTFSGLPLAPGLNIEELVLIFSRYLL